MILPIDEMPPHRSNATHADVDRKPNMNIKPNSILRNALRLAVKTTLWVSIIGGFAYSAHAQIVNGGFEDTIDPITTPPGWTSIGQVTGPLSYLHSQSYDIPIEPIYEGEYYYDLGGIGNPEGYLGSGIMQSVPTTIGKNYTLKFGLSSENQSPAPDSILRVTVDDVPTDFTLPAATSTDGIFKPWETVSVPFTATHTLTVISFTIAKESGSYNDPVIDGVTFGCDGVSIDTVSVPPGDGSPTSTVEPSILRVNDDMNLDLIRRRGLKLLLTGPPNEPVVVYVKGVAGTGGHTGPHGSNQPHGWLAASSAVLETFFPKGGVTSNGSTIYSTYETGKKVVLEKDGAGELLYVAPQVSGDEAVTVSTTDIDPAKRKMCSTLIHVSEGGLIDLEGQGLEQTIKFTGQTTPHPSNHWVTPDLDLAISRLAINYAAEHNTNPSKLPPLAPILPVNDTSLQDGGLFDISGLWAVPHVGHRVGTEVDIGGLGSGGGLVPHNKFPVFERMWKNQGFFEDIEEGTEAQPHFHLVLTGVGKVAMAGLLPEVTSFDGTTIVFAIPLQNQGGRPADEVVINSLTAGQGVQITDPIVSEANPKRFFFVDIRSTVNLNVTATVPEGISKFNIQLAGTATSFELPNSTPWPVPGVSAGPGTLNKLTVIVGPPTGTARAVGKSSRPLSGSASSGLIVQLTDADQAITLGSPNVYHGTITNDTGAPIPLSAEDVYYQITASEGAYNYDLADEFVSLGGLIPTEGYSGPLFTVQWTSEPAVASGGDATFILTPDASTGLAEVQAISSIANKPQTITSQTSGSSLTLSWSLEASGMTLVKSDSLDDPGWMDVDAEVTQSNGVNTVTINAPTKTAYFRLVSVEADSIVGESAILTVEGVPPSNLLNISTRIDVQTGDNVMIGGFIITGTQPKKVILRAIGPTLSGAGITNSLADPILELHQPDGTVVTNDNWKDSQQTEIQDSGIPPKDGRESAIVATLAPGAYTAIVTGKNGTSGVGLVEAYDLDQTADSTLANISTRGFVSSGDSVMIGGFIVGGGGNGIATVVLRAVGPSLGAVGVANPLQDPTVELHDGNGETMGFNNNWTDDQQVQIEAAELSPSDERESALEVTLAPGAYTAIVRGAADTTGVALVEAYRLED